MHVEHEVISRNEKLKLKKKTTIESVFIIHLHSSFYKINSICNKNAFRKVTWIFLIAYDILLCRITLDLFSWIRFNVLSFNQK